MLPPRPVKISRGIISRAIKIRSFTQFSKSIRFKLADLATTFAYLVSPWIKAALFGPTELKLLLGPPSRRKAGGVVIVAPYRGEANQIAPFIEHHSKLGVREFVFLDLSADGSLRSRLEGKKNCALWRPRRPNQIAHVVYWLNFLRRKYATGRWCLSLEPNERFVFYRSETRHIMDLVEFLTSERRDHVYALLLEMYGEERAELVRLNKNERPEKKLIYFDKFGYSAPEAGRLSNAIVRGGIQRRTLYRANPEASPSLSRIPLVKWRWYFAYISGRRLLMPARLNKPHAPWHSSPTACLLRYALLDPPASVNLAARIDATEIMSDGRRSCYDAVPALRQADLKHAFSGRFTESLDLVEVGLINPGQWF
jgi:hypothetical protein